MNAERRKELSRIIEKLEAQLDAIETVKDEEEECYDNLPEQLQDTERGEAMQENYEDLDSIYDDLQDIIDRIQDVIDR